MLDVITTLNNTFLLYKKGEEVNIDLSDYTINLFNYIRPDDSNINSALQIMMEK